MSEKCVHDWYYRIVGITDWQFFCIRCGEKLSMDKFSDHASDLEKNASKLNARIAELEAECASLGVRLHDEMSQLEIATDLGNKRWTALNKIYEDGEKHNTNWCKRKAQKGLGIK